MNSQSHGIIILGLAVLGLIGGLIAQQQTLKEELQPESPPSDSAIITKLEEIVSIREGLFETYEILLRAGRIPANSSTAIELADARIELARERGEHERILAEMQQIVLIHEEHIKRLQGRSVDQATSTEVERARALLLEAEVRLLRAKGQKGGRGPANSAR
jgi:hypothetical protein